VREQEVSGKKQQRKHPPIRGVLLREKEKDRAGFLAPNAVLSAEVPRVTAVVVQYVVVVALCR